MQKPRNKRAFLKVNIQTKYEQLQSTDKDLHP